MLIVVAVITTGGCVIDNVVTLHRFVVPTAATTQIPVEDLLVLVDTDQKHMNLFLNCILSLFDLGFRRFVALPYDEETNLRLKKMGFVTAFNATLVNQSLAVGNRPDCERWWLLAMDYRCGHVL